MNIKLKDSNLITAVIIIALIGAASMAGYLFQLIGFSEVSIVLVYLLSVFLTSVISKGYTYGIFASVLATAAFNYFFTQPYFSLSVHKVSYIVTFVVMTIVSIITSTLTSKVKQNSIKAQEKEAEARALYNLTNYLTNSKGIHDIANGAVNAINNATNIRAECLYSDEHLTFLQNTKSGKQVYKEPLNLNKIRYQIRSSKTTYCIGEEFWEFPLCGVDTILGIIRIPKENAQLLSKTQIKLLSTMIKNIALAMDKFRLVQSRIKINEKAVHERYRGNLLRSISHDLRTPLSGIMGTSEMIMSITDENDSRYNLALDIYKDASWLNSLTENILSLTKLQDGGFSLNKQPEAAEEVIEAAIHQVSKRFPKYEIYVNIPNEILIVPMDAKLITQVLINLLDNAIKHTPINKEINISVKHHDKKVIFSVSDEGEGIKKEDLPNVFRMFYTTKSKYMDNKRGIGLGLAICETIIKAHSGHIEVKNRTDKQGTDFIFSLPLEVK